MKRPSFVLTFLDGTLYGEPKEAADTEPDWTLETREPGGVWPCQLEMVQDGTVWPGICPE